MGKSSFCDRLITFLINRSRFANLFARLASILVRTDWDLFLRNCSKVDEMSSVTKVENFCFVSSSVPFSLRIWLWQIEILALMQCLLASLKMGW